MEQYPFHCIIRGRGGHGAMPHETVDPVIAAAAVLQTASEGLSCCEASVAWGAVHSGTKFNIIPETAELTGVLLAPAQQAQAAQAALRHSISATLAAMQASAELTFIRKEPE